MNKKIDNVKGIVLFEKGKSDRNIAEEFSCTESEVKLWRRRKKLVRTKSKTKLPC